MGMDGLSNTASALLEKLRNYHADTFSHSLRVSWLFRHLLRETSCFPGLEKPLFLGALLHDIGKLDIPTSILDKKDPLTDDEWRLIKTHPLNSYLYLKEALPIRECLDIALYHHERWDGNGYARIRRDLLPDYAFLFSIVDAFDAMTSKRAYNDVLTVRQALEEIRKNSGTQFSPAAVEIFCRLSEAELAAIMADIFTDGARLLEDIRHYLSSHVFAS